MTLGELSEAETRHRLAGPGLRWQVGPFVVNLQSGVKEVAPPLRTLYGAFPLTDRLGDFFIRLAPGQGVRRWWRPQVRFQDDLGAPFAPFPRDHALPYFEWGWNFSVGRLAQHFLMLHAGVVAREGRALLLPGLPASGKSTLSAALMLSGWRLLSDEFALIRPETGEVWPFPRPIPLKNAAIEAIRAFAPDAMLGPVYDKTRKGRVAHLPPSLASVVAMEQPARVALVIQPAFQAGAATMSQPLPPDQLFPRLAGNAFNYPIQGEAGFRVVAAMARGCPGHKVTFGDLPGAVAAVARLWEGAMGVPLGGELG